MKLKWFFFTSFIFCHLPRAKIKTDEKTPILYMYNGGVTKILNWKGVVFFLIAFRQ